MDNYECYAIIDKDTEKFLKSSHKLYVPFYNTQSKAENALKGYKRYYGINKNGYKIVRIKINNKNIEVLEER